MTETVYCILGPTACGKTALSLALAEQLPIEIVSVDSALVYRHMDIGTAKPSQEEQHKVAHHLLDRINPDQSYSVAQFCQDAHQAIQDILSRQRIPLLVGGTMMYFKALQQGLAHLPAACANTRRMIERQAAELGWPALHRQLADIDPASAKQIKPNDQQRIQRALEVYQLSGQAMSTLLQQSPEPSPYRFCNILLLPQDRQWLHQRIAQRFEQMLDQQFVQEVQSILKRWPQAENSPAMRMVGYRQALSYLRHQDYPKFIQEGVAATRQLAKRQITWLRSWPDGQVFDPQSPQLFAEVLALFQS